MNEEDQLDEMIQDMFEGYLDGGLDFTSSQSLEDIFKGIFSDAVKMTIDVLEEAEDDEEGEA